MRRALTGPLLTVLVFSASQVLAQQSPRPAPPPSRESRGHGEHMTPRGWKFSWPKGDASRGRQAFAKFECYRCHEVKGEKFPAPTEPAKVGPELAQMGPLHEPEYFAESVINPNAVIEKGKGYQAADGSSKMPSFNELLSVQELIDLVAFLRALKPPSKGGGHAGH